MTHGLEGLIRGEILLTIHIIFGLILGEIIMRLRLPELLVKKFQPFLTRSGIPPVTGIALALSAGSSKAGAALISSALEKNQISEKSAVWSVIMLALPSYLKRWPSTLALAVGMTGKAGLFFALAILFSSTARFFLAYYFLRKSNGTPLNLKGEAEGFEVQAKGEMPKTRPEGWDLKKFLRRYLKTLPLAWIFFALAYLLVPSINNFLKAAFSNINLFSFMPLAGWTVAASSIARVSAALALAGGALASGELNAAQAVFALILGNGLGTATRILRMNAGYYFGFFPAKTAQRMLLMNFLTIGLMIFLTLIFAGLVLLFNA